MRPIPHPTGCGGGAGRPPEPARGAARCPTPSGTRPWPEPPGPAWPSPPIAPHAPWSAPWAPPGLSPGSSTRLWTPTGGCCPRRARPCPSGATPPGLARPGAGRSHDGRPGSPVWTSVASSTPWSGSAAVSSCPPTRGGPPVWTILSTRPTACGSAATPRCCHRTAPMTGRRPPGPLPGPLGPGAPEPISSPRAPAPGGPWPWSDREPPPITGSASPPESPPR